MALDPRPVTDRPADPQARSNNYQKCGSTSKFAEEEQIYTDIAARAGKIRDKFDAT